MTLWLRGLGRSREKLKLLISLTTVYLTTKLGMVTYLEGYLPIISHDTLITSSCEITWLQKPLYFHYHFISTTLYLPPNFAEWWLILRGSYPYSDMTFNLVILLDHETIQKIYISTSTILMATKFGICLLWGGGSACKCFSRHRLLIDLADSCWKV